MRSVLRITRLAAAACALLLGVLTGVAAARPPASARVTTASPGSIPHYDHIFLIVEENHNYHQIIGNLQAPVINALASDYGLEANYTGVGDPSEPNYVGMLGGSTFHISSDDPYWFPGHTVHASNLMSQLDGAGLSWKGYFQGMPYAGYRGYCFPAKCNGIPDSDTQYVAKHNGIVNFADEQTPSELAKMQPYANLASDLHSGNVPNLSYIVPDECHDMHGAPPWCVDSGLIGGPQDNWLVGTADQFVSRTVGEIQSSRVWKSGNDAIVVVWDEGNSASQRIPMIVVTNHGPRHVTDRAPADHYALLATLQHAFGLGCLRNSCAATPIAPLFADHGKPTRPVLPHPTSLPPNGPPTISATGPSKSGPSATLSPGGGWQAVPSPSFGGQDNNLDGVSAASASDAWAVGDYYLPGTGYVSVLKTLAEHWDGTRWTAYPLPNVGANGNTLLGVSELPDRSAWAVGYEITPFFHQRALVEHWDGKAWHVVNVAKPAGTGDILYGVTAIGDDDVWAVGGQEDRQGIWHPLAEHFDGAHWSVVPTPDPNGGGNLLYALAAVSGSDLYAAGQSGTAFPSGALVEHWNGSSWSTVPAAGDATASLDPFGLTAAPGSVTLVGARESDTSPFTTLVASGSASGLGPVSSPSQGAGENDLFAAATAADGSTWADGWYIDPSTGNHQAIIEHGVAGQWSIVPSPEPGAANGDVGLAGLTTIPGGGLWAVGITSNAAGNPQPLIEYHP